MGLKKKKKSSGGDEEITFGHGKKKSKNPEVKSKLKDKTKKSSKSSKDKSSKPLIAKPNKGDFLIVENGKNILIKVLEVEGRNVTGINQAMKRTTDGQYEKRDPVTVKADQILVNLGRSPKPGTVYGAKIEPLYKRVDTETCGQILFFVDATEEQRKMVKNRCIKMFKRFDEKNLGGVPLQIEIRSAQGKYAGWYKFFPRADADVLCIKPNFDLMQPKDLDYVIAHEYAHGIWFRMMSPRNIAAWIALYDKHMALTSVGEEDLQEMLVGVHEIGSVRTFIKECEEEDKLAMRAVLRSIRQVHSVDAKHLDYMLRDGMKLDNYWPSQVEFSDKGIITSAYAQKSPEEFFAESFSFWFTGQNIPKAVKKLLDRSLSQLSRGRVNGDEDTQTNGDEDED